MAEEVQIFNFENQQVRTIEIDNEPWFVGKDVAEILGYTNPRKALRDHVDEEDSRGGTNRYPLWKTNGKSYQRVWVIQFDSFK